MKKSKPENKSESVRISPSTHALLLAAAEREVRRPAHVADRLLREALEREEAIAAAPRRDGRDLHPGE